MLRTALSDCLLLDLFPFSENGFVASEVDVCGCDVVQALVVALVIVVIDESPNLAFEIARQAIVFQQNTVLHDLMPAFDFALGLRVAGRATNMCHLLPFQPFDQIARDVAGPIITQQAGFVAHDGLVATGRCSRQFDRVYYVLSAHVCGELPCNDVAAVIIQDCTEIIPTPADNLEVGEAGLPPLSYGKLMIERQNTASHSCV